MQSVAVPSRGAEAQEAGAQVTAPTPDAVAQAREGVWGALEDWQNTTRTTAQVHRDVDAALDAYAAAVRAECAADTKRLDWLQREHSDTDTLPVAALVVKVGCARRSSNWANVVGDIRATIDRVMQEAQP